MLKIISHIFLSICLFLTACHATPDAIQSDGKPLYLSDYRGKWMVVNYWATWCHPCLAELPELNTLYRQHADTIVVLGVSFDGLSNTDIQQFAKTQHLTFPLLSHFPIEKFSVQDISSLPMSFLITPQGKLAKILYGTQTEKSILENIK
jgi:peroxiredoxin